MSDDLHAYKARSVLLSDITIKVIQMQRDQNNSLNDFLDWLLMEQETLRSGPKPKPQRKSRAKAKQQPTNHEHGQSILGDPA